jgi:ATP-dependent exoDNAse (exonuclease V) beta subunit
MAKGLQFDHVILPGLNREIRGDSGKLLHWFEWADTDRIVLAPMHSVGEKRERSGSLVQYISGVEKRRQILENGRLLYVAATRAIRTLHLFAGLSSTASGGSSTRTGTLLAALWPAIEADHAPAAETAPAAGPGASGELPIPQLHRRLAADWRLPPLPPAVETVRTGVTEAVESIEFRWAGETARLTGELVHRLLQRVAEQGPGCWQDRAGRRALEDWCRRQLSAGGVIEAAADDVLERVRGALDSCLSSERGRWLLAPHEDAHCEYAITALVDGTPRNLVLDRTFVADDERWIIDYKTSSHAGGGLESFLASEEERYAGQLARYREALAITETRRIRTALYFPLLDQFREV